MAVFRAGPWGTLNDPYQPRPPQEVYEGVRDFGVLDIGFYPVNVANTDAGGVWNAFYSAKQQVCPRPTTLTAESFFGPKQLEMTPEGECSTEYYWANPSSPFYGELRIRLAGSVWEYRQLISGLGFGVDTYLPIGINQTQEEYIIDPTGLYDQGYGPYSYNVTTP